MENIARARRGWYNGKLPQPQSLLRCKAGIDLLGVPLFDRPPIEFLGCCNEVLG
jgi:hypothetical protein